MSHSASAGPDYISALKSGALKPGVPKPGVPMPGVLVSEALDPGLLKPSERGPERSFATTGDTALNRLPDLMSGDHHMNPGTMPDPPHRDAAVLIPIIEHAAGPQVLLTQRATHLSKHAGQISFPGGRTEPFDPDLAHTALRETHEEVGLQPEAFELVGELPLYITRTGFAIRPFVALIKPPIQVTPDPSEVAEVFEVPLNFLMDPGNHQRQTRNWQDKPRYFWAIPYHNRYIWGATAGILVNLSRLLNP